MILEAEQEDDLDEEEKKQDPWGALVKSRQKEKAQRLRKLADKVMKGIPPRRFFNQVRGKAQCPSCQSLRSIRAIKLHYGRCLESCKKDKATFPTPLHPKHSIRKAKQSGAMN